MTSQEAYDILVTWDTDPALEKALEVLKERIRQEEISKRLDRLLGEFTNPDLGEPYES